jgi:hypothetical protein
VSVSSAPNSSLVRARVLSHEPADDGWGSWAELQIEDVRDVAGVQNAARGLVGSQARVFVPPTLTAAVRAGESITGALTFRGGGGGGIYALTHAEALTER